MEAISDAITVFLHYLTEFGTFLAELFGVLILLITTVKSIIGYFRKEKGIKKHLASGTSLALEFMLGAEVLHTLVEINSEEQVWTNVGVLGCTIIFRVILTVLLHWEMKNEKEDE